MCSEKHTIRIADGNLYLDHALYETYFHTIETVILLSKPPHILIMPVLQSGTGGLLMKIRNTCGDRVVRINEFLENNEFPLHEEMIIPVVWDTSLAALVFSFN